MKKTYLPVIGILFFVMMQTGCGRVESSCGCYEQYPQLDEPYTPYEYTLSETDFNSLFKFDEYFLYHDSTIREHDGDTIKVYGYIPQVQPNPAGEGETIFKLEPSPVVDDDCSFCFGWTYIHCPKDSHVEEWMTESGRLVYVEGIIKYYNKPYRHGCHIAAIHVDSVKF